MSKENDILTEEVDRLDNYSRRNIICVANPQEGCEGDDLVSFFTDWIPAILGKERFTEPLVIEGAHQALAPNPSADQRQRLVLICLRDPPKNHIKMLLIPVRDFEGGGLQV